VDLGFFRRPWDDKANPGCTVVVERSTCSPLFFVHDPNTLDE
jgi:hypothetical protein